MSTPGDLKQGASAVDRVTAQMEALGIEELAETTKTFTGSVAVLAGAMQIFSTVPAIASAWNAVKTAHIAALTAQHATNPVGWGVIQAAAGAGIAIGATVSVITCMTLRGDLSDPSGRAGITQQIGSVIR